MKNLNLKVTIALFLCVGFTVASLVIIGVAGVSNIDSLNNDSYSTLSHGATIL